MNITILKQLTSIICRSSPNGSFNHITKPQLVLATRLITEKSCSALGKMAFAMKTTRSDAPVKKPVSFDYSGDLITQKPIDPSLLKCGFKELSEIKQSHPNVQRLCSIEFADGKEVKQYRLEQMSDRIENLFGKDCIYESIVSKLTVDIRNMIQHCLHFNRDKRSKAVLVEKIQRRKKMMKYLRRQDYEHFQWLLRELKIKYVLPPAYYGQITRKFRRKEEAVHEAVRLRREKLKTLEGELAQERVEFEKYKVKTLAQIEKDISDLNLDADAIKKKLVRKIEKEEIVFPHGWTP
ncbi:28S ribosomal protein S15, mitochondrial-like [Gigantopelta aegis]|uniref:28S ribosomal protein S15, mitochondrial-like n=1 Tax=Gigantopelta aegis TaxID=1735272 RepID=UPI001B888171|nr:28S ribosomal protein S15, mitochondrial-like [Gigantopelta aegis]